MTVVIPADPRSVFVAWLRPLLPTILPGWTAGARIKSGITPSQFVLVDVVGGDEVHPVADNVLVRFQVWGPTGTDDDYERTRAARVVAAHARRDLLARRISGFVPLPDPTDPARTITQVTVTALIRGEDL